jgi:hypothetical protein
MTRDSEEAVEVLRSVWSAEGTSSTNPDEDFAAQKVCRNMKDVTFDGMAEPGSDLREAWRDLLAREGKLSTSDGSIRDLVLGHDAPR